MFVRFTVALSLLSAVLGAEWSLNSATSATMVTGVSAATDSVATAAASQNGLGAIVERLTDGQWKKKQVQAGMLLDTVVTPSGNTIATSTWNVFLSTDNGNTYNVASGVNGVSQSANTWGPDHENFALVGNFVTSNGEGTKPTKVSGVAYSTDKGATWSLSKEVPPGYARYGAFPTDSIWYVASGIWGTSAEKAEGHRFSSRMEVDKKGFIHNEVAKGNSTVGASGWFGAVSKTTDGGNTWTNVFNTDSEDDYLYFNGIACGSVNNCVVAAEGYSADGAYLAAAYTTFDGTTWTRTLTTDNVGMMQVDFVSETEAWLVGTYKDGRNLSGKFYHTTDGGKSWTLAQSLDNCYAIDLDMGPTTGYAACSSSSGSSCSVAVYA